MRLAGLLQAGVRFQICGKGLRIYTINYRISCCVILQPFNYRIPSDSQ